MDAWDTPNSEYIAERSDVIQNGPQNRILQLPADHDTLWASSSISRWIKD